MGLTIALAVTIIIALLLRRRKRKRTPIPTAVKRAVYKRDHGRCRHCGSKQWLEYDHIKPFSLGGKNTVDNLQLLCRRCNEKKGNRYIG